MCARAILTAAALAVLADVGVEATRSSTPSILIFSKTEGYRHDRHAHLALKPLSWVPRLSANNMVASIPDGIDLVSSIAAGKGWSVEASEDSSLFTNEGLSEYTTLVFISTTGNFLSADEAAALEEFLLQGGSWLGIHAAGDFGNALPAWFNTLVGGQFLSHPCGSAEACDDAQRLKYPPGGNIRPDTLTIETHDHPSTVNLPRVYNRTDEWYSYKTNVAHFPETYTVLTTLAEHYIDDITLFPEREHMDPHPISWYSTYEGKARAFYTGQGHTKGTYYEPYFVKHITGALEWVTGESDGVE